MELFREVRQHACWKNSFKTTTGCDSKIPLSDFQHSGFPTFNNLDLTLIIPASCLRITCVVRSVFFDLCDFPHAEGRDQQSRRVGGIVDELAGIATELGVISNCPDEDVRVEHNHRSASQSSGSLVGASWSQSDR